MTPFPDYRQALTRLADGLRRHPLLTVEAFTLGDPLPGEAIRALEGETGYVLTDDLRALYRQMNGLRLKWFLKPGLSKAERQAAILEFAGMDVENSRDEYASAAINILPLQEALRWGSMVRR
ncbi:SMI1/KNR4 family protein [Deinococcus sp. HMF7604]|uniref:SMI1/KNR4 family protein n=1 Tax=Deinococcus betulae TaxID=2873312 RepID=UPI001CCFA7C8|nr:SMI1/KNR4 family protein [Deinococcus betulae]MBZ9752683.1 SMI1/KNR4 family protein [Deinococcus betulae]